MLEIVDIKKKYELKDQTVDALKGVSIRFRDSEFVSILGPSGCGKTTLLNIIGGLDKYTSGDLIIDGTSTKEYKDKDWDNYRNHKIGFVFQSYNLIPQLTVLENVELALTLSGIKKKDRKNRAIEVLNKVGLGDKLKSKPNQLSGGQMQRVAIARALVNDPEIILADEPTGALDSKTSVQIMDLLKEVSEDRLVIMVTHNPDLAKEYSTRIINLLDGELLSDSKPYKPKKKIVVENEKPKLKNFKKTTKKKSMSFFSALALSFKNLLTKKGRTILVSFAGSIGIIGIALVMAVSSGFSGYVNKIQENTLSTYPITIQAKSVDFSSLISSMMLDNSTSNNLEHDKDAVYTKDSMTEIFESISKGLQTNNLNKFYHHINDNYDKIEKDVNAIQYTYNLNLEFYKENSAVQPGSQAMSKMITKYAIYFFENKTHLVATETSNGYIIKKDPNVEPDYSLIDNYSTTDLIKIKNALNNDDPEASYSLTGNEVLIMSMTLLGLGDSAMNIGGMFSNSQLVYEMIDNEDLINEQYDLVAGSMARKDNEAILVLDKNNEIDEYELYTLGLLPEEEMNKMLKELANGNKYKPFVSYADILKEENAEYKVYDATDFYYQATDGTLSNKYYISSKDKPLTTEQEANNLKYSLNLANKLNNPDNKLKIVGIVRLKEKVDNGSLSTGIAYTNHFTENMINHFNDSEAVEQGKETKLSLDNPASINIYASSFDAKQRIQNFIDDYNKTAKSGDEISYTDYVGIIMNSVSTIISSITYVLVAFVSVSLIVSSIMIGIITYISVIERTKEIGVLRSVGASKKDISHVFNAETTIIGFSAGLLGVTVAGLLSLAISAILKKLTGIAGLAVLSPLVAVILITISVLLTLIAGLVPARIASKKDPVLALRSE